VRLAITGANGWFGLNLVRAARSAGHEVVGVVRSPAAGRAVHSAGGEAALVPGLEGGAWGEALVGCSVLVHLAGISAERAGATYADVNMAGMRRAIEAARRAGVPRIVFLSGLGVAHYGMGRRTTNGYFLAKLAAEVDLFCSGLEAVVLRPSYIVGPEDELVPALLAEMAAGEVEIVGDGAYRLQPIAVEDACRAVLRAAEIPLDGPLVIDLVGAQAVTFREFVLRLATAARSAGRAAEVRLREKPLAEADAAAASGGYRGLLPDELDVLLCDETADPAPLAALLGTPLTPLDQTIDLALAGSKARATASFRR